MQLNCNPARYILRNGSSQEDLAMFDVTCGQIRYNAARQSFEARVDIRHGDRVFRYPCEVKAPIGLDEVVVRHALAAQAQAMSDSPGPLRSVV